MEADLKKAAFAKMNAIAGLLGLPCYWGNVTPVTAPANTHLQVDIDSAPPRVIGTCGKARRKWFLKVFVWVRDGVGTIVPAEIRDAVAAELPIGMVINGASCSYTITDLPAPVPPMREDGWYITPCLFPLEHID